MHEQGKGHVDLKGRPWSDIPTNQVTPKTASQPECQRQTSSQPPKEAESNVYPSEPADNKPLASEAPNYDTFCRHFGKLTQMSFNNFFQYYQNHRQKTLLCTFVEGVTLCFTQRPGCLSISFFPSFIFSFPPSLLLLSFLPSFLPFLYSFLISFSSLLPNPQTFSITLSSCPILLCTHHFPSMS